MYYELNDQFHHATDQMDRLTLIDIITRCLYDYPSIQFYKNEDTPLLYKDLIKKTKLSPYEEKVLFVWNHI